MSARAKVIHRNRGILGCRIVAIVCLERYLDLDAAAGRQLAEGILHEKMEVGEAGNIERKKLRLGIVGETGDTHGASIRIRVGS